MKNKLIFLFFILSILFSNTLENENYPLGRDNDPKVVSDIKPFKLWNKKATWSVLSTPGMRFIIDLIFPKTTIAYFDIDEKIVAFTIDDGFCGADNPDGDMTNEVRELFKKYDAKATFFVTGSHCEHTNTMDIKALLEDGIIDNDEFKQMKKEILGK